MQKFRFSHDEAHIVDRKILLSINEAINVQIELKTLLFLFCYLAKEDFKWVQFCMIFLLLYFSDFLQF